MRVMIEGKSGHPKPIAEYTALDKALINFVREHNLRFLQCEEGCVISDKRVPLADEPGITQVL